MRCSEEEIPPLPGSKQTQATLTVDFRARKAKTMLAHFLGDTEKQ